MFAMHTKAWLHHRKIISIEDIEATVSSECQAPGNLMELGVRRSYPASFSIFWHVSGMFRQTNDENLKWPGTTAVNLLISAIRSVLPHVFLHVKISEHDFGKSDTNQSADSWRQVGFMRGLNAWTMSITRLGFEMQRTYGICMNLQNSWNRWTMTNYTKQIRISFFHFFPTHFSWDFSSDVSCRTGRAHVVLATCLLPSTPSPIGTASMRPRQIGHFHKWRSFEGILYTYIMHIL
jgi:hypothetical protein